MKKILSFILIGLFLLIPTNVNAEEINMDDVHNLISKDRTINMNIVPLDKMESIVNYESAITAYISNLKEVKEYKNKYKYYDFSFYALCTEKNNICKITISADNINNPEDGHHKAYNYTINYNHTYDENTYEKAIKLMEEIEKKYYIYDLEYVNQIYNSSINEDNSLMYKFESSNVANFYQDFKLFKEKNNEFTFTHINGGGGYNLNDLTFTKLGDIIISKDGITYGTIHGVYYSNKPILFVNKNTEKEKYIEETLKRINKYINNEKINIKLEEAKNQTITLNQHFNITTDSFDKELTQEINEFLNTNESYSSLVYELTLNDKTTKVFIIPVEDKYIKEFEIKSFDKSTGTEISTQNLELPLDTTLKVKDMTTLINKKEFIKVYDFNLESSYKINNINNSNKNIKVSIPVENNFDETNKKVFYINETGEIIEEFDFTIENKENKKYITFNTNHFSMYAIGDKKTTEENQNKPINNENTPTKENLNNPNTGENLLPILLSAVISCLGILIIVYREYKEKLK